MSDRHHESDTTWLGERVVAHLGFASGGYAELAVVDAARAYRLPGDLDAATAVAAIGTGRTAAGILDLAGIAPDDVVAVTSAAGGLGVLLLQGVRNAGAAAIGLAGGPAKVALAERMGADAAVDYRATGWQRRLDAAVAEIRRPAGGWSATGGRPARRTSTTTRGAP